MNQNTNNHTHCITQELPLVALFIVAIWGVFFIDRVFPLEQFGLIPRQLSGLTGIFTMPFLHANLQHIMNNTVPLTVLLLLLAGSRADSRLVVLLIMVLGGLLLWLFGRSYSLHIGASGLVFGLASFLMVSGLLERRLVPMLISVLVAFLYGTSLLAGLVPWQPGVSWDGHLFGGIAGAFVAWLLVKYKQQT